ncbi:hypothetical protein JKP88DRAFT_261642 [Tribonema minus]|uniref:Uncharacterized protein n=1 Tax=Tribonema minus TaxID=303371 RepID=A0A835YHH9_9STRA|nr:hypothetical protein JKP88DRAFT_261642 [Tribonema minus]
MGTGTSAQELRALLLRFCTAAEHQQENLAVVLLARLGKPLEGVRASSLWQDAVRQHGNAGLQSVRLTPQRCQRLQARILRVDGPPRQGGIRVRVRPRIRPNPPALPYSRTAVCHMSSPDAPSSGLPPCQRHHKVVVLLVIHSGAQAQQLGSARMQLLQVGIATSRSRAVLLSNTLLITLPHLMHELCRPAVPLDKHRGHWPAVRPRGPPALPLQQLQPEIHHPPQSPPPPLRLLCRLLHHGKSGRRTGIGHCTQRLSFVRGDP